MGLPGSADIPTQVALIQDEQEQSPYTKGAKNTMSHHKGHAGLQLTTSLLQVSSSVTRKDQPSERYSSSTEVLAVLSSRQAMTALLRQRVSQALFSRLAARVFTSSSHVEAAATAASGSKPSMLKEFQVYRWDRLHLVCSWSTAVLLLVRAGLSMLALGLQVGPR